MSSYAPPISEKERAPQGAPRRWVAVSLALIAHLAILMLFLSSHPRTRAGAGVGTGAMDVALAGFSRGATPAPTHTTAPPPIPTSPPSLPVPLESPIKPRSVVAIVSDILSIPLAEKSVLPSPLTPPATTTATQSESAASGSQGAACDLAGTIQSTLVSDPMTHQALVSIPRQNRSAADAVMLWNGRWTDAAVLGGAPVLTAVQSAIRGIVSSARADCRDQINTGPRFIFVPEPDGEMIIAIGSGSWRWSDMMDRVDDRPEAL